MQYWLPGISKSQTLISGVVSLQIALVVILAWVPWVFWFYSWSVSPGMTCPCYACVTFPLQESVHRSLVLAIYGWVSQLRVLMQCIPKHSFIWVFCHSGLFWLAFPGVFQGFHAVSLCCVSLWSSVLFGVPVSPGIFPGSLAYLLWVG